MCIARGSLAIGSHIVLHTEHYSPGKKRPLLAPIQSRAICTVLPLDGARSRTGAAMLHREFWRARVVTVPFIIS